MTLNRDFSPTDYLGQNKFMDTSPIDEAILSVVRERWKKVARVIVEVSEAIGYRIADRR